MHEPIESITTSAAIGLFAFIATNLDDLFLVLAFMADRRLRTRDIVIGQYAGMAVLVGISCVVALISLLVPLHYIGWLGLIPIALGIKALVAKDDENDESSHAPTSGSSSLRTAMTVAAVTIANGGDNIGVYVPIFAVREPRETLVILGVFALSIAALCGVAHALLNHRAIGAPIRNYAHVWTPIVLILIGAWVIYEAGSVTALF